MEFDDKLKALIVEDHSAQRKSIREMLLGLFPFMVVMEAKDGKGALLSVDAHIPDLIFMDIKLPDGNGLDLTKLIKKEHPQTRIAIITNHNLPEYREAALKCGGDLFIPKDSMNGESIKGLVEEILLRKELDSGKLGR
ncbi:MAG: response regulator transcription factor [Deltaproteobacteria bacterium]|uniref:Response regulator transcription factor n=1 Tax=Candidatus Zymogenus saltonus TaxID=2844893 RepID=A0A9D8KFH2_9DELT|nr:response regulator transcription factor [Candidatus Zymogenus saltonus]